MRRRPRRPRSRSVRARRLNVVVAGVLGLMVGVFLAFFLEFWSKTAPGALATTAPARRPRPTSRPASVRNPRHNPRRQSFARWRDVLDAHAGPRGDWRDAEALLVRYGVGCGLLLAERNARGPG